MGEKPEFEIDWKEIQNQDARIVKLQFSIGVVTSTNKLLNFVEKELNLRYANDEIDRKFETLKHVTVK